MLEQKPNLYMLDDNENTALHHLVTPNWLDIPQTLIETTINYNLSFYATSGLSSTVKLLICSGADASLKNNANQSSYDILKSSINKISNLMINEDRQIIIKEYENCLNMLNLYIKNPIKFLIENINPSSELQKENLLYQIIKTPPEKNNIVPILEWVKLNDEHLYASKAILQEIKKVYKPWIDKDTPQKLAETIDKVSDNYKFTAMIKKGGSKTSQNDQERSR